MTPEAQRIAIAEACGWRYSPAAAPEVKLFAIMRWIGPGREDWYETKLPDYINDLNAMHEAEKVFLIGPHKDRYSAYLNALEEVTNTVRVSTQQWDFMHATAAQRAEAFLKTLGKWTDA